MGVRPSQIPVAYEPWGRTTHVGTFEGGKFMGFAFYLELCPQSPVAVLHEFDAAGTHTRSNVWPTPTAAEAERKLEEEVSRLPGSERKSIAVRLFKVQLLGRTFGMVGRGDGGVEYVPYDLLFHDPWDGTYDT